MNKIWGLLLCTFFIAPALAQNKFIASIKSTTGESLAGATVAFKELKIGASANTDGLIYIGGIPNGTHTATFSFIGFKPKTLNLSFPLQHDTLNVALAADDDELDEIIVSSTRVRGSITDVPTRMEVLTTEELGEKSVMKPGDIRMVLNETTGITTQQTSATSGNTSIQIQGLDGRYTQILKDGFPLYAGFSGGLSLLQTPPLDLKQVEIIKGSASTLYGGGAIAGLVNLISKTPSDKRELSFQINGTSAGGLDLNSFYAEKYGKAGITVFAAHNRSKAYDPSDVGFSAIPEVQRFTFNPKLFIDISDKSTLSFGLNSGYERRIGGDMHYIRGENDPAHPFFEKNLSKRLSSQLAFDHQLNPQTNLSFKNSLNYFNRDLSVPSSSFSGEQFSSFSEFTLDYTKDKSEWIFGANFWSDSFREKDVTNVIPRDYDQEIFGLFAQNTYQLSEKTAIETGLRGDYVNHYGLVLLPRVSALFKLSSKVSSRIGGGFGYQTPNIFTDEAEQLHFEKVLPINTTQTKLEKSVGGNIDFNYRTTLFTD
ncbi:TonB-dependent receptor [Pelobium manganitolerans]|uniref:TonB-dependent receptor n=1 Tax=Pelobium manganitolerans TaxID=1842495 RepID=UPI003FA3574F